jgi:hypothetical protein
VPLCLYALIPAFVPLTKAPPVVKFCNGPQLSRRVDFNLFNIIEPATFHCFLQLWEQEEVARSKIRGVGMVWERRKLVFRQKFICGDSPVGRDIVMVQDQTAGAPLLRAMSAHGVAEALQDCFMEFLMYLCNLSDSQTSVSVKDFSHTCHILIGVGDGRTPWARFVFKGPVNCLRSN